MRTVALEDVRQALGSQILRGLEAEGHTPEFYHYPWMHPGPEDMDQDATAVSVGLVADPNLELPDLCYSVRVSWRRMARAQAFQESSMVLLSVLASAKQVASDEGAMIPEVRFAAFYQVGLPEAMSGGGTYTSLTMLVRWRWRPERSVSIQESPS